jgi:hypothetical protein
MIIADRILMLRTGNGDIKIPVRVFLPDKGSSSAWSCRYEIDWPDKKSALDVGGVDSIQAITLALQLIGAEIYSSSYHKSGILYWEAPGKGYGFPVTAGLRDLLQGDDAKFF